MKLSAAFRNFSNAPKNADPNTSMPHVLCALHHLGTQFCDGEDQPSVRMHRSLNTGKTERNSGLYQETEIVKREATCRLCGQLSRQPQRYTLNFTNTFYYKKKIFVTAHPLICRKSPLTVTPSSSDETKRSAEINLILRFQTRRKAPFESSHSTELIRRRF